MRRLTGLAALAVALATTGATPAHAATKAELRQVIRQERYSLAVTQRKLRATRRTLREARVDLRAADVANESLADDLETVTAQKASVEAANLNLLAENNRLVGENNDLRAGLPDAIRAVPLSDFPTLVFAPARAAWTCDSYYTSSGFWSYTFDSPNAC